MNVERDHKASVVIPLKPAKTPDIPDQLLCKGFNKEACGVPFACVEGWNLCCEYTQGIPTTSIPH